MAKPRGNSDPLPPTNQYGGYCSFTLPASFEAKTRIAQPFTTIGASALLGQDVSHSGWIRKEGFSVKTWRSRFMVLHHGCIYYFKETDSGAAKGKFPLNGYRCEPAPERDSADRFPYVFKLVPGDDTGRTYYFSSPSKTEMEGWIKKINIDIRMYCLSPDEVYDYVDAGDLSEPPRYPTVPRQAPPVPTRRSGGNQPSSPDGSFPHSLPTHNSYSPLSGVRKFGPGPPKLPARPMPSTALPDQDSDSDYESVDPWDYGDSRGPGDLAETPSGDTDFPRYEKVIFSTTTSKKCPIPPKRTQRSHGPAYVSNNEPEDLYLDLQAENGGSDNEQITPNNIASGKRKPVPPKRPSRDLTAAVSPSKPDEDMYLEVISAQNDDIYLEVIAGEEDEALCEEFNRKHQHHSVNHAPKPHPKPLPPVPPQPPARPQEEVEDNKDFDYLPHTCFKPDLHKNEAKVFLELCRTDGVYIVHASQSSDTKLVLSVWISKGIKHYLIFKKNDLFTLDPSITDERFAELRKLVEYYYSNPLPRSSKFLTAPFSS